MSPEQLLGQIEAENEVVLADFEAGLGTLSRMKVGQLDVALVVTEPTAKALEVARRAVDLLREQSVRRLVVVANRVGGQLDRSLIASTLPDVPFTVVPDDAEIRGADSRGVAPFDAAPDAPAVRALRSLAESLVTPL